MTGRLEGKVAIITGGTTGMGRGTVDLFLKEGAKVVVGDVQDDRGAALAKELGSNFSYIHCDVSQEDQVKGLVDHAIAKFGKLDVMFNNAGIGGVQGRLHEIDMDGFRKTVGVLFKGVVLGYKYASVPMMNQKSGSIISTASVAGTQANHGPLIYSCCKAAVINFSKSASISLAAHNVRSNVINPGTIATNVFSMGFGFSPEVQDRFAKVVEAAVAKVQPIQRAGQPNDIAEAALYLASDASTFMTGQALTVDGGLTAGMGDTIGKRMDFNKIMADFIASLPDDEKPRPAAAS